MNNVMRSLIRGNPSRESWRFDTPGSPYYHRLFWKLQLTGWSVVGLCGFFFWGEVLEPRETLFVVFVRMLFGITITSGLRELYRRMPWRRAFPAALFIGAVCVGVALGLGETAICRQFIFPEVRAGVPSEILALLERISALIRCCTYFGWSVLYFAIRIWHESVGAELQAIQSENAVRAAEVRQLQSQINPHFLFNALNSIIAEKDNGPALEKITHELADYLRYALSLKDDFASLGTELDLLERYLRVEKSRFEERLIYHFDVPAAARAALVPAALVQPLLENACKYGRRTGPRVLCIKIMAALRDDTLEVTVTNTGRWLDDKPESSHGIGLTNLRRRLELLSQGRASLRHHESDGHVSVTVTWPINATIAPHSLAL